MRRINSGSIKKKLSRTEVQDLLAGSVELRWAGSSHRIKLPLPQTLRLTLSSLNNKQITGQLREGPKGFIQVTRSPF
jgi:hypothetical protein